MYVLTQEGDLYVRGQNGNSQLCFPANQSDSVSWPIPYQKQFRQILVKPDSLSLGDTHVILKQDSTAYGCGFNYFGIN